MPAPIVIHGNAFVSRWFVKAAHREEFIAAFNGLWQGNTDQIAEVTNFVFFGWGRDADEFVAIESWKSEEMVSAMRQSEGFRTSVTHLLSLCSKPMEMQLFSPWEGDERSLFSLYPAGDSKVHPVAGGINTVFK